MHGPEHHIMVGCALLTAYHNAGGEIDLPKALNEMVSRDYRSPYAQTSDRVPPSAFKQSVYRQTLSVPPFKSIEYEISSSLYR